MPDATALATDLTDAWDAERAAWSIHFDSGSWMVEMEWTDEYASPHRSDWTHYVWEFHGATPEEALTVALEWAKGLLPFATCGACDGRGWYGVRDASFSSTTCEECGGTGLANRPVDASA